MSKKYQYAFSVYELVIKRYIEDSVERDKYILVTEQEARQFGKEIVKNDDNAMIYSVKEVEVIKNEQ